TYSLQQAEIYRSLSWRAQSQLNSLVSKDPQQISACDVRANYLSQLSDVPRDRRDEAVAGYLDKLNEIAKREAEPTPIPTSIPDAAHVKGLADMAQVIDAL